MSLIVNILLLGSTADPSPLLVINLMTRDSS